MFVLLRYLPHLLLDKLSFFHVSDHHSDFFCWTFNWNAFSVIRMYKKVCIILQRKTISVVLLKHFDAYLFASRSKHHPKLYTQVTIMHTIFSIDLPKLCENFIELKSKYLRRNLEQCNTRIYSWTLKIKITLMQTDSAMQTPIQQHSLFHLRKHMFYFIKLHNNVKFLRL